MSRSCGALDLLYESGMDMNWTFTAPIQKDGSFPTYLTVEGSREVLGTGRPVKVAGTLDGHEFAATLMPSGTGPHWLPLKAAYCKTMGKSAAGEQVTVHVRERLS